MIKCVQINTSEPVSSDTGVRKVTCVLFADTADEVKSMGGTVSNVENLNDGDLIQLGSVCVCATADVGFIKSTGDWDFGE